MALTKSRFNEAVTSEVASVMKAVSAHSDGRSSRRFEAIVLAAGASTRFGASKLAAKVAGRPLLAWALEAASSPPIERIIVAGGRDPLVQEIVGALQCRACPIELVEVSTPEFGMGHSLAVAARQLSTPLTGVFVFLGDMPLVRPEMIVRMASALRDTDQAVAPFYRGRRGHPVLFAGKSGFDLQKLAGDTGARSLLDGFTRVTAVEAGFEILMDVDTNSDLARARDLLGKSSAPRHRAHLSNATCGSQQSSMPGA